MARAAKRRRTAWAPHALPSILVVTSHRPGFSDPEFELPHLALNLSIVGDSSGCVAVHNGAVIRLQIDPAGIEPPAVLLPLDLLFEHRANAAVRAWRTLLGRSPGPNPAALPKARQERLILALRAIDGHREKATYREIAEALFGKAFVSGRAWKTHDVRDRTIRLVRFGLGMMQGGYRRLLLHPYRS